MAEICHNCGEKFDMVAVHWSKTDCSHPPVSEWQHEVLTGLVLGDAHVSCPGRRKYPSVCLQMSCKRYLNYLSERAFPVLSNQVTLANTAEQQARNDHESGFNRGAGAEDYSDSYWLSFTSHPDMERYKEWYSTGQKVFPPDLELTSTVLKHWFVGDGSFCWQHGTAVISLSNEGDNENKIVNMFRNVGLTDFNWYNNENMAEVRFRKGGTENFYDFIGDPLPGFEYKWPEDRR